MNPSDFEPLAPDLADVLRDDREASGTDEAPAAAAHSVRRRIELSIAGLAPLPSHPTPAPAAPPAAPSPGATALSLSPLAQRVLLGVVISLSIGVGAGALGMRAYDTRGPSNDGAGPSIVDASPGPQPNQPENADLTASRAIPSAAPTPTESVSSAEPKRPSARPSNAVPTLAPTPPLGLPAADLIAERLLLDDARAALLRGEGSKAIPTLSEHVRRYPKGRLAEERDALLVQALVRSGRRAEAFERGERFIRQYPGSLLAPAVRDALATNSDN